jgi:hypothetical protein
LEEAQSQLQASKELADLKAQLADLKAQLRSGAKQQAASTKVNDNLKQKLKSTQAQLQQQRQATASAQVATQAKTFAYAKLAAQLNQVHTELGQSQKQRQADTEAASLMISGLKQAQAQLMSERDAAVQARNEECMQHSVTKAALADSAKELQASRAALSTCEAQLSHARKEQKQQQAKATAALAAAQHRLSTATQRMQQSTEAAARAFAAANASRWIEARTAAESNTLQEKVEQVRMQRDAAAAFAGDLSTQLQQANAGKQVAEHALTAERQHNSALLQRAAAALKTACSLDSCSSPCPPAAHPTAAASPTGGASYPADTDLQDSSDDVGPATPPRRTLSWRQMALSVLGSYLESGVSSIMRRSGSEGGSSSSTGSNSSSRDASSGGFGLDAGSAGSKMAVVGVEVDVPDDACAGQLADDTDVFFDAQEVPCAAWV